MQHIDQPTRSQPQSFGERLRRHRIEAGLTQEQLAERAGLSVRGLSDLERGTRHSPYPDTIERLASALKLTPEQQTSLRACLRAQLRPAQPVAEAPPTNLPSPVTSFIGRERALADVKQLLSTVRLLTLTGAGGVGKTRLALQVGAEVIDDFADGVWLVDLAAVTDPSLVSSAALMALGIGETPGQNPTSALAEYLKRRHALLLLDNCEHLLEACGQLASLILRECAAAWLMVTSRELLGVAGETAWRVPSLDLPGADDELITAATAGECEAVRLFVDRARSVQPTFAITDENAPALAQVCRRLDGIPLALELAAARVRVLTVEQIAARLNDRFRLLTGGGRTALRRQQTLQALIDWSHDLLDEREKALFRRLAVFSGGWTLEAAESVATSEPLAESDVLDVLTSLVDKSLVVADAIGAAERYTLLETMRQYAEDKLLLAGEATSVRDRHRDWCLATVRALDAGTREERAHLAAELDNLRAALTWCLSDDVNSGLTLLCLVGDRWAFVGGGANEGRRWLETFLHKSPEPTATRAEALLTLGHYLRWSHEFALDSRVSEEALAIYRALDDKPGVASATSALGVVAANRGDYALAFRHLDDALASARLRADLVEDSKFFEFFEVCRILRVLGTTCIAAGDFARARAALTESVILARRGSVSEWLGQLRLATLDRLEGEHMRAHERLVEANGAVGPIGAWGAHLVHLEQASQARAVGQFDEARAGIVDGLRRWHRSAELFTLAEMVAMLGICEIAAGQYAHGVALLAVASQGEGPIGTVTMPDVRIEVPIHLQVARDALGDEAYSSAWAEGQATTLSEAVESVLGDVI